MWKVLDMKYQGTSKIPIHLECVSVGLLMFIMNIDLICHKTTRNQALGN